MGQASHPARSRTRHLDHNLSRAYCRGVEMRHLGDSGLVVSAVGLGCNNLGRPGTARRLWDVSEELSGVVYDLPR
jgi:1-deoxyxylulose-5-phosphate synthase